MSKNIFRFGGPKRFNHQLKGLEKIIDTGGKTALLYEPGTGKTAIAIDYIGILASKLPKKEAKVLVICPLVAVDTWVKQMEKFCSPDVSYWAEVVGGSGLEKAEILYNRVGNPQPGTKIASEKTLKLKKSKYFDIKRSDGVEADPEKLPFKAMGTGAKALVLVMNYDSWSQNGVLKSGQKMPDALIKAVKAYQPDLVILDESHKIKAANSNVSRALAKIGAISPRRLLLTGTVMPHDPLDVYGQWRFLDPIAFPHRSRPKAIMPYGQFKETFADFIGFRLVRFKNLDKLQDAIKPSSVVCKKEQALDLPPYTDAEILVDLSAAEDRAYHDMKKKLVISLEQSGETIISSNRLVQVLRLRQLTSGFTGNSEGETITIGNSKTKAVKSLVEDTLAGEKRIVIFCVFLHEIASISRELVKCGEVMTITGAVPVEKRIAMRKRFGSDDPARMIMVAQINTMSLAVNELVTASHAIFPSMTQERAVYIQARDRLTRIGQTKPVTFWHILARKTIDTSILKAHATRTKLEDVVLEYLKK